MSAHIFIDAENVQPEIGFKAVEKFGREYAIERVDIIGKEDTVSNRYLKFNEMYHFQNCYYGKNSADTWICTEIAKTIFEKPEVEVIILVSSDRDFLPAIKLATEQNRKVIVVSYVQGHKNLKALLWDLKVNPSLVELVDFQTIRAVAFPKTKFAKKDDSEKDISPNFAYSDFKKMLTFYPKLSSQSGNYFRKRESQIKFIFVKHGDKLEEIPFIDGMETPNFITVLIELKVIDKGEPIDSVIAASYLKQVDRKVYLCSEDELLDLDEEVAVDEKIPVEEINDFDRLPSDAKQYFGDNIAKVKTIFLKNGDVLNEVPFIDGMPVQIFSRMIRELNFVDKNAKFQKIAANNFLKVKDNCVYLADEEDFMSEDTLDELGIDTDKLSPPSLDFLQTNISKIKFVNLNRAGVTHKVPFVEGMHLSVFCRILHELKIVGKSAATQSVLINNGFKIKERWIYRR